MIRTVEAVVDEQGHVRLTEAVRLTRCQRALVTILEEDPSPEMFDAARLSELALT